jgi:PAS domain S-box-containing protein
MLTNRPDLITGGGEMGRLMRAFDWTKTSLGEINTWPQSLRTTLSIILNSKFPMFLFWGPELLCFYNDAYRPSLGNEGKHPDALGKPGEAVWPEIWPVIKPLIDQVLSGGEATWSEDQLIPIYRNGKIEDVYWTFSYSPVHDERGQVAGVFVTCSETTQKVASLQRLQLSEQRFRNLVRQSTAGIIVLSGENMVVDVANIAYGELINRDYQELIGKPVFEVIPEARPYFYHIIEQVRVSGEPVRLYDHPYFVMVDGLKKEGFLDLIYQPYKEQDGSITGVMVLCHDVTDKVLARKKVEESEDRLGAIIAAAPAAIGLFMGRDLIIEYPNQAFIDIVGKGPGIVGKPLREAMPELITENQPFLQILDEVYTSGKMFQSFGSQVMIMRDGVMTYNYYNITYTPLFNTQGEVYAILDIAVDVTGEIEARQKLEKNEEQLRMAIEGAQLGTYDYYPQTGEMLWSAKTKEFFGLPAHAGISYDLYLQGLHPDDRERSNAAVQYALKPGNSGLYENEYRTIGISDGKVRWVRSKGRIEFDTDGKPIRFTGIMQDISGQKQAEASLKASEMRLRRLIESNIIGVLFWDLDGGIVDANDAFLNLLGYTRQDIELGLDWRHMTPPQWVEQDQEGERQVLATGYHLPFEKQYLHKDGTPVDVIIGSSAFEGTNNRQGITFVLDITARKKAEKAMQESEARFRLLADQVPQFIWMTSASVEEGIEVTYSNKNFLDYLGFSHYTEFVGTTWEKTIHPDDLVRVYEIYLPAAQARQAYQVECRFKEAATDIYRWFIIHGVPRYEAGGGFAGYIGTGVDIHDRKQFEMALRESEERFRMLADNISQLAWIADGEGYIFWYNKRWYDYTGTTLEEMQGWGWEKVHHPDYIERVVAFVKPAWQKGERWELEFPIRRHDGQYGWFLTRAIPIHDQEGKLIRWFGTNTDITEQQMAQQRLKTLNDELAATTEELAAANEELRAANEEIQASNEELGETNQRLIRTNNDLDNFVYTASHDLKAPITNIEGLMRILERNFSSDVQQKETVRKLTGMIYESIARFKRTIADLTEVTKVQKGEQEPVMEVNLRDMTEEVKLDLETQIIQANAQVVNHISQSQTVRFSRKNLKSIIYNLLSNAIKYHSPERRPLISINVEKLNNYLVLTVADNGLGMNLQADNQIFQMFRRLHNHVEGSGIGLYIVKKMIDNAGGRIEVESQVGQGSLFRVYFRE